MALWQARLGRPQIIIHPYISSCERNTLTIYSFISREQNSNSEPDLMVRKWTCWSLPLWQCSSHLVLKCLNSLCAEDKNLFNFTNTKYANKYNQVFTLSSPEMPRSVSLRELHGNWPVTLYMLSAMLEVENRGNYVTMNYTHLYHIFTQTQP